MKLTKENILDWKPLLNAAAVRSGLAGENRDYFDTMSEQEWLEYYADFTPEEAVNEEISQMG